jgi:lysophospholipase L1-like esterase
MNVNGKKILILGDSLSASASAPGGVLGAQLRAAGGIVRVNGRVSRSAENFFSGKNGEDGAQVLAAEASYRPDIVVVMLGTNDMGLNPSADALGFQRIASAFPQAQRWAIGPPAFARADYTREAAVVYVTLASVFGADRVIDWRGLSVDQVAAPARSGDGVHFTSAGARVAGERLAAAVLAAGAPRVVTSATTALRAWWPVTLSAVVAGAAVIGTVWVVRRRRRLSGVADEALPERERQHVHKNILPELDSVVERAVAAGARGPLEYIGAGAEGVVFCDATNTAFKVGRRGVSLEDEADFLRKAGALPRLKKHVAKFIRYDKRQHVLVRECVRGERLKWSQERKAYDLTDDLEKAMEPYGFLAPERKPDSWIMVRGRGPVLVDAGFATKVGGELVKHTLDVITGRAPRGTYESSESLAFHVRQERGKTIPPAVANKLLRRLYETPENARKWAGGDEAEVVFGADKLDGVTVDRMSDDSDEDRRAFHKATADKFNAAVRRLDHEGKSFGALTKKVYLADAAKAVGIPMSRLAPMLLLWNKRGWVELQRVDLPAAHAPDILDASTITHRGNDVNAVVVV